MAITREIVVRSADAPSDYTAPAQTYVPSSLAQQSLGRTIDIAVSGVANADNLTGFNALLTQLDTDFGTNVLPTLGLDATQTIDLLIVVRKVRRGGNSDLIVDDTDKDNLYTSGTESFRVWYDIYHEETA